MLDFSEGGPAAGVVFAIQAGQGEGAAQGRSGSFEVARIADRSSLRDSEIAQSHESMSDTRDIAYGARDSQGM